MAEQDSQRTRPTAAAPAAVIVQQGKLLDFIDQLTQREETPEEYVRQEIAKSVVREYGYPRPDVAVEFPLRLGSSRPRADLIVFNEGAKHEQVNIAIIVECKAQSVKASDRKAGVGQLQSYMAACANATYGMWTNGLERFCFRKTTRKGQVTFDEITDIPAHGQTELETGNRAQRRRCASKKANTSASHVRTDRNTRLCPARVSAPNGG